MLRKLVASRHGRSLGALHQTVHGAEEVRHQIHKAVRDREVRELEELLVLICVGADVGVHLYLNNTHRPIASTAHIQWINSVLVIACQQPTLLLTAHS